MEYDFKASIEYGKIRATLEKSGKIIGGLDMQIAAHALANKMTLVTNNTKEFKRVQKSSKEFKRVQKSSKFGLEYILFLFSCIEIFF